MMKNPNYCRNLIQAFFKIIQEKQNLNSAAAENDSAEIQRRQDLYKSALNVEKDFFERTGYLYPELAKNIAKMEVED